METPNRSFRGGVCRAGSRRNGRGATFDVSLWSRDRDRLWSGDVGLLREEGVGAGGGGWRGNALRARNERQFLVIIGAAMVERIASLERESMAAKGIARSVGREPPLACGDPLPFLPWYGRIYCSRKAGHVRSGKILVRWRHSSVDRRKMPFWLVGTRQQRCCRQSEPAIAKELIGCGGRRRRGTSLVRGRQREKPWLGSWRAGSAPPSPETSAKVRAGSSRVMGRCAVSGRRTSRCDVPLQACRDLEHYIYLAGWEGGTGVLVVVARRFMLVETPCVLRP